MNQTNVIKINNNIKVNETNANKTLELSKSQLDERFNINLDKIINGFRNVPSFIDAQKSMKKDSIYRVSLALHK